MAPIYQTLLAAAAFVCTSACAVKEAPDDPKNPQADRGEEVETPTSDLQHANVTWSEQKNYDLTGDGIFERLYARAFGPTYDSLLVVFEIHDSAGHLLYRDRWPSQSYFAYDYRVGKPDTTVARIVLGNLIRLLSQSSFISASDTGPRAMIDTMTIRYDLAETQLREKHGLQDTSTLSIAMLNEIEKIIPPNGEADRIAIEVKTSPRFIYFAGGELTYTIAWSKSLQRFVRVFSCC